jgi:hypothetical protein
MQHSQAFGSISWPILLRRDDGIVITVNPFLNSVLTWTSFDFLQDIVGNKCMNTLTIALISKRKTVVVCEGQSFEVFSAMLTLPDQFSHVCPIHQMLGNLNCWNGLIVQRVDNRLHEWDNSLKQTGIG